jgi:LDH2 family malate/lactate/ureidoglycolate dehydrogenase
MDTYTHRQLTTMAVRLLSAAGMDTDVAETVADILVEADLMGHTTHGLNLLVPYIEELESDRMRRNGAYEVVADTGSTMVWDGNYASGVYLTAAAVDEGLARSRKHPVVTCTIRRAHHIGCLAAYMPRIIDAGRVGILAASDPNSRIVAPHGARSPAYSPNPVAAGIPAGPSGPVIVDISTSVTAAGVVNRHREEKTPLPAPWLIDGEGNPTDDPSAFGGSPAGSILPLGGIDAGYKGYALALIVEALTSGLGGYGRKDSPTNWGTSVFLQIIDPEGFSGLGALEDEMAWTTAACRNAEPRAGYDSVRVPGDRALALKARQLKEGVNLSDAIMDRIRTKATALGVTL